MKAYLIIIAICLANFGFCQTSIDLSATGVFNPSEVAVGDMAMFEVQVSNVDTEADVAPANGSRLLVTIAAGSEILETNPPVGPNGDDFTWTFSAPNSWIGICNVAIPLGTTLEVHVPVTAVAVSNNVSNYNADILPINSDPNGANDTGGDDLSVVATLPVELTSFDVRATDCSTIAVEWETAQERNSRGFSVERSIGKADRFEEVSFVESGRSNSRQQYKITDDLSGLVYESTDIYYRLKQVDLDGAEEYFEIASVKAGCLEEMTVSGFPNPVLADYNLEITGASGVSKIIITNQQNELVSSLMVPRNELYKVDFTQYTSGVYSLTVLDDSGNIVDTKRIIKVAN